MTSQVRISVRAKKTVVSGHGRERSDGAREAESTPRNNRAVSDAPTDPRRATRPPEMVSAARAWDGDQASSTKAKLGHYAHKPIVRGTMHARGPREPIQQGQREMPSVARGKHLRTENDDTDE